MFAYILRRLMLVVPTLIGIMVVNFFIIQAAPGGPVEQMLAQIQGTSVDATERHQAIGRRRFAAAAPVTGRPRLRAGAFLCLNGTAGPLRLAPPRRIGTTESCIL